MDTTDNTQHPETTAALPPAPAALNQAVEGLMSQIESLSSLYQAETDALRRADTKSFAEIQDTKIEQAIHYEADFYALMQHQGDIRRIDPALKEKLRALQEEFSVLVQENAVALSRMKATTTRLNTMIINATRETIQSDMAVNYGKNGRLETEGRKSLSDGRVSKNA